MLPRYATRQDAALRFFFFRLFATLYAAGREYTKNIIMATPAISLPLLAPRHASATPSCANVLRVSRRADCRRRWFIFHAMLIIAVAAVTITLMRRRQMLQWHA